MKFSVGIRNIEKVLPDIVQYLENEYISKKFEQQGIDTDKLYDVIGYMLRLAEDMHLDYNLSYTIAVLHDYGQKDSDENNFSTLSEIMSDAWLLTYFTPEQMEIISLACKEHDGLNDEFHQYSSLYSKAIADADTMSIIKIEPMLRHFWKEFSEENSSLKDKEIFDLMYDYLKKNFGEMSESNRIILKKSYEMIKEDWYRTKKTLADRHETLEIFLTLVKYHDITTKNDGTLVAERKIKKQIIVDDYLNESAFDDFENGLFESNELNEEYVEILTEAPKDKSKRQQSEELIYKVLSSLDVTGLNVKKYKEFFSKMTDEQFDKYMKTFLKDEDENFYLEILPNKNEPSLEQVKKALDILKVPTDEYVYLRHEGHKDDPIRTAYRVPVGYITIKRVQQILSKKNTYSLDIAQRNMKTGQVTGADKIARISDVESYSLVAIGADHALQEFLGPRADNSTAKTDMYKDINLYGYSYLKDMGRDITENQTLNTLYVYLMGAGLENDLLKEDMSAEEIIEKKVNRLVNK
jgi:hypothetical protein